MDKKWMRSCGGTISNCWRVHCHLTLAHRAGCSSNNSPASLRRFPIAPGDALERTSITRSGLSGCGEEPSRLELHACD